MTIRTLALLLATAGIAMATEGNTFHWNGRVVPGQVIEIIGVNGNIHAEASGTNQVEVTAEKTGRRSDPAGVHIDVVNNGAGYTICAVYPSRTGRNECRPGSGSGVKLDNNDVKVEFSVRVPRGVRFIGRTVNGGVGAIHLGGDVEAHTVNGKIVVSTSGAATADTVNGSIHAITGSAIWDGARKFHTVNGSIELELPGNISADLNASTVNGSISSQFPVTVHGRFVNHSVHGTLGRGGRELDVSTVNGSIILRQAGAV